MASLMNGGVDGLFDVTRCVFLPWGMGMGYYADAVVQEGSLMFRSKPARNGETRLGAELKWSKLTREHDYTCVQIQPARNVETRLGADTQVN